MSDTTTPEYRTGFDEAPSTFNQEDAAPADYPPLPTNADLGFLADDIREEPVTWSLICDLVRKAIAADRTQRSGVSADPLPDQQPEIWDYEAMSCGGKWIKESRDNGPPDTNLFVIRNLKKRGA